jgi:hypothetical protein
MRRMIAALLTFALLSALQPAQAAGAVAAEKEGPPGTNVEMPFLIAPMSKDGKLLGYAYILGKLVASTQSAAIDVRDKLAFIQDAFVRDVNGAPIGKTDDPTQVDIDLLKARLTADARRIVGQDKVDRMIFTDEQGQLQIKFAPLHPGSSTDDLVPPSEKAPGTADASAAASSAPGTASASPAPPATSKPAQESSH